MICKMLQISSMQEWLDASGWLRGRIAPDPAVEQTVREIIGKVATEGDAALLEYTREFDAPDFQLPFKVDPNEIARGAAAVPIENREQIAKAASNIRTFHEAQLERSWFITREDGSILGQRVLPIERAGLYVPGGQGGDTPLVSSLLMNAVPAKVAGCKRIVLVTPPRPDGTINPYILAAAYLLDLEEIYRVGGAWSIAALALGTTSLPKVDIIAGPGNIYVSTAKRLLQGSVGIDMLAGPSEILILADSYANPVYVAADMLSQAEHDPLAAAICITDNKRLADAIEAELRRQIVELPRQAIAEKSLNAWGCIAVVPKICLGVAIANAIAPEHLELCVRDPWELLPHIQNAGAIFMGQSSPEPVGDYFIGPNHVLPTLGTARFSSGLAVQTFCKKTNVICATRAFLKENADDIAALARLEGLDAHARAIETRA